jgi:hypothetical protein
VAHQCIAGLDNQTSPANDTRVHPLIDGATRAPGTNF